MNTHGLQVTRKAIPIAGLFVLFWAFALGVARSNGVVPTNTWVDLYSTASTLDGQPLPVGAYVAVYDPQGVQCGQFTVHSAGWYGIMPCYGDDPMTGQDEGARPGDLLRFTVNGIDATAEPVTLNRTPVPPNTSVTWTQNGDLWQVDLHASTAATATPTPTGTATATPSPTPVDDWRFWGYVYRGQPGDTSSPLSGATVRLYGSQSADDVGRFLRSDVTGANGWFGIYQWRDAYSYFHLFEEDPPGYVSTGATAEDGGVVVHANHIRFRAPPPGYYTRNAFFDDLPTPTPMATDTPTATPSPTCTVTPTCTATHTPTATRTPTSTPAPSPTPTAMPTTTPTDTPRATPTPTEAVTPTKTPVSTPVLSTIAGHVWEDEDRDGQRGSGERGIPGQKVTLDPGFIQVLTMGERGTVTDAHGYYQFRDVAPGVHVLKAQCPAGYWPTTSTRVKVLVDLHQTVEVSFGFYRPPVMLYLPLVQWGKE